MISRVLEQHADELVFLWDLRREAADHPQADALELTKIERRMTANLRGLLARPDVARDVCREQERLREPAAAWLQVVLAGEHDDADRMLEVLLRTSCDVRAAEAAIAGLAWIATPRLLRRMLDAAARAGPGVRSLLLMSTALLELEPSLEEADVVSDDSDARRRALVMVGLRGRRDLLPQVLEHLRDPDATLRFWAAWAGTRLGAPSAKRPLLSFASSVDAFGQLAVETFARCAPVDASAWIKESRVASLGDAALLTALAARGRPSALRDLCEHRAGSLGRIAGEAFSTISGVDLLAAGLARADAAEEPPNEDPKDANVAPTWDAFLPDPCFERLRDLLEEGLDLQKAPRLFLGRAPERSHLEAIVRHGRQRQRLRAALELDAKNPGSPLVNVCGVFGGPFLRAHEAGVGASPPASSKAR